MKKLRVTVNGISYDVEVEILEDDEAGGSSYGFPSFYSSPSPVSIPQQQPVQKPQKKEPSTTIPEDKKVLTSPIAGIVVEVKVKIGDMVKINDPVVVIEAMKMNTNISSPVEGKVKEIKVKKGDSVQQGQVLITFE